MIKEIALADIRLDGGTQQRFEIDDPTVQKFANDMKNGADFPPVTLVYDGASYFLVDGFHRCQAYSKNKTTVIKAEVSQGTRREAIWMSLTVNQTHGLRLKSQDIHKMVMKTIFPDSEWSKETDAAIADLIGYSPSYVVKKRKVYADFVKEQAQATPETEAEPETEPETETVETPPMVLDELGHEVPEHLALIFTRRPEIKEHIKVITTIFKTIKDAQLKEDLLYVNCRLKEIKADLGNIRTNLRNTLPHAVCPMCGGDVNNQECRLCKQHGFVNEDTYKVAPEEMKGA